MARIIDALKGNELRRELPAANLPEPEEVAGPIRICEDEQEEEFPFIEVDGTSGTIVASPDVMSRDTRPIVEAEDEPHLVLLDSDDEVECSAAEFIFENWSAIATPNQLKTIADDLIVYHHPHHPVSRQYKQLVSEMVRRENLPQTMYFTALGPRAGVTTAVLNLASAVCDALALRTIVVDLNWQSPALARRLGLPADPGLHNVLAGSTALEQAIHPTAITNLSVLPVAKGDNDGLVLWSSDALRWVITRLRDRFDVILLDAPPWDIRAELSTLAATVDVVYPVLEEVDSRNDSFRQMVHTITRKGGRVRGLIRTHLRAA